MKTLKVEAIYAIECETFSNVAAYLPRLIDELYNERILHSSLGYVSPNHYKETQAQGWSTSAA